MTTLSALSSIRNRPGFRHFAVVVGFVALSTACAAQDEEVFSARLSPFPVIGGNPGGLGEARATLSGTTLEVSGSFEGLTYRAGRGADVTGASAAGAQLHAGPVTAVDGAPFADLVLAPGEAADTGTISGSVELTPDQVEMLRNGQVYAQVDSEEATGGHLWGWFLQ